MATDYLGILGNVADYSQMSGVYDDARDDMTGAVDQARTDVTTYQQPYVDFGLQNMQEQQDMGAFSFSNEDFYNDPSYQFRLDESLRGVERSMASQKMLSSTNTLDALTTRAGDMASQEYQAAFERAKGTYETNVARQQFGIEIGANAAMNLGDNLASIGIAEGAFLSSLTISEGEALSTLISSTLASLGQPNDPDTVSGLINGAIDSGLDTVGAFVGDLIGGDSGAISGAVDAGLGALGIGSAAVGTAEALGTGGLFGTASGIGAEALGGATGAAALGGESLFAGQYAGVLADAGITSTAEGAAATGLTADAFTTFMMGIGGTALTLLGPLAIGLAMTWNKDRRSYTDKTEDELAESGNPVLSATGMYMNAIEGGDSKETAKARGVLLDTINNSANTTDVKNSYYAGFTITAVMDTMSKSMGVNFTNDAGKALRTIYPNGGDAVKDRIEKLVQMDASLNTKYDNIDQKAYEFNTKLMLSQLIRDNPIDGITWNSIPGLPNPDSEKRIEYAEWDFNSWMFGEDF